MLRFNNNHIFTGYIKQLLSSFNLPKCRIYREDEPIIETKKWNNTSNNDFVVMYVPYIKDNELQEYVDGKWVPKGFNNTTWPAHLHYYEYNKFIPNYTKRLEIRNNIYDSYTHEYLGDYLRFHRDYAGIDLMPLYNCFSNRICNNLNINFFTKNTHPISFQGNDPAYKIYMLPIKLFREYTIAIDSEFPIEICCGIYGKYQGTNDVLEKVPEATYERYNSMKFATPVLYSKLKELGKSNNTKLFNNIAQNELNLKMFIKVPIETTSTITILEGNYLNWNDTYNYTSAITGSYTSDKNYIVYDSEKIKDTNPTKFITNLQLLQLNTNESYPFADRLIEYLIGNTITNLDSIPDNISRIQALLNTVITAKSTFDDNGHAITEALDGPILKTKHEGLWDNSIRAILYNYMNNQNNPKIKAANHDILGYVDKDVEKLFAVKTSTTDINLNSVDIYPNIYKKDKEN